jgi:phosphotransacetylase
MIRKFSQLHEAVVGKKRQPRPTPMGVLYPTRPEILGAVQKATLEGLVIPLLIGPADKINEAARAIGFDIGRFEQDDAPDPKAAAAAGIKMVTEGRLRFLLQGHIETREFVNIISEETLGFRNRGTLLSHVAVVQVKGYRKLMFINDTAVTASPDVSQKIQIIEQAAGLAKLLGVETPRAALLAAVEQIYPAVPVTMEEAAIAKMSDRGQIKSALVDGPLSFDVAISKEVARSKGITNSRVAGKTDIFVSPTIETASALHKALLMFTRAEGAGIYLGGKFPMVSTTAVDKEKDIYNSILLGCWVVQGG